MKKNITLLLVILVFTFCSFTNVTFGENKALQEFSSPVADKYDLGGLAAAEKEYKTIIKKKNDNEYTYIAMAILYIEEEKYDKAINICITGLKKYPKSRMLYNYLGSSLSDIGEYDKAIWAYGESIEIEPSEPAYYNRGKAWAEIKNNHTNAISDYTKALECLEEYKNNPKVYNNMALDIYSLRAISYASIKDYTHAIADFDMQIKIDNTNPGAYFNRAQAKMFKLVEDDSKGKVANAAYNATVKSVFNDLDLAMKYSRENNNVELYNKALKTKKMLYEVFGSKKN